MADIQVMVDIKRPPEAVFDTLADIAHYSRWLPPSKTYRDTSDISDTPIRPGTTYLDQQTSGTMYGQVREYKPFSRLVFHQASKGRILGLDITIRYELTRTNEGTHLERTSSVISSGIMRLLQSVVIGRTREENQRTLETLKAYLEARAG